MESKEFERALVELLSGELTGEEPLPEIESVRSYEQGGVLCLNPGLVVRFVNGCELQLTIVRSR